MTIKEMLKKIEKVNKLNEELNLPKKEIFIIKDGNWSIISNNMKEIKKWIKDFVLLEVMEKFLNSEYIEDEWFEVNYTWFDGWQDNHKYIITILR